MRNLPLGLIIIYAGAAAIVVLITIDLALSAYHKHAKLRTPTPPVASPTVSNLANLAFGFMLEEVAYFLKVYRELDQNHRDKVRLPLSPHSYPNYGDKWEHVDCCLWMLNHRVRWLAHAAEIAWKQMGWTDTPALFLDARDRSIVMANLIGSLDEFRQTLKQKLSLFQDEKSFCQ
jgi:hypothetical protein